MIWNPIKYIQTLLGYYELSGLQPDQSCSAGLISSFIIPLSCQWICGFLSRMSHNLFHSILREYSQNAISTQVVQYPYCFMSVCTLDTYQLIILSVTTLPALTVVLNVVSIFCNSTYHVEDIIFLLNHYLIHKQHLLLILLLLKIQVLNIQLFLII